MNPINNTCPVNNSFNNLNIDSIQSNPSNPSLATIVDTHMGFLNPTDDQIDISFIVRQSATIQIGAQDNNQWKRIKLNEKNHPVSIHNKHTTQDISLQPNNLSTCSEIVLRRGIFPFLKPEDFRLLSTLTKKFYELADVGIIDWLNFGNQLSANEWLSNGNQFCSLFPLNYQGYSFLKTNNNLPEFTPFLNSFTSFLNRKNNKLQILQLNLYIDDHKYSFAFREAYRTSELISLFPNLKSLAVDLGGTEEEGAYGLINADLQNLQTLQLKHCSQTFLEKVLKAHKFESLKNLFFDYSSPSNLQVFANFPGCFTQLREFYSICIMTEETAKGAAFIAQLPAMNTIQIAFGSWEERTVDRSQWFSLFGASITTITRLESLEFLEPDFVLENSLMSNEKASVLVETLTERMPSLRTLKGCDISDFGLNVLALRMFKKGSLLEELAFDYEFCPVPPKDLASFALLPNLTKLDLSNMKDPDLVVSFFDHLSGPIRLHKLNLSKCSASDSIIKALYNQIIKISSVRDLDLSSEGNLLGRITEEGMKDLIAVEDALGLTKLDLSYNRIDKTGFEVLLASLQKPFIFHHSSTTSSAVSCPDPNRSVRSSRPFTCLQSLNLSGNNIFSFHVGPRSIEILAEVINGIPSLKLLSLCDVGMDDERLEFFVAKINTLSLDVLDLSSNGFSSRGAKAIIRSTEKFCLIEAIRLPLFSGKNDEKVKLVFDEFYKKFTAQLDQRKEGIILSDRDYLEISRFMDLYEAVKIGELYY